MSNLHVDLDELNKHDPKGFIPAVNNTFPVKDELGNSFYEERMSLPKAINFVDGTVAAPTTVDGDIYVLTGSGVVDSSWGGAAFGDWVRFLNTFATPITPLDGYLCFDETAATWMQYDGSVWAVFGGGGVVNTIFTGGTMAAPSTILMASNGLTFDGGQTTFKSSGSTDSTTAVLFRNILGADLLELKDGGASLFSGNVGFGQSTPTFNVHIEDAISSANGFKVGNSTNLRACTINTGGDIDLFDSVGTNAIKLSQGTNSFILNNLGIGRTNPTFNLDVQDINSSSKGIRVGNTTGSSSCTINTAGEVFLRNSAGTSNIKFSPDFDSYVVGDFGIGLSTNPLAKLHAKGSGITSGTAALLVQNNSGLDLLKTKDDGTISAANLSTYASDFAAGVGGLVANDIYKTSTGELRIKI